MAPVLLALIPAGTAPAVTRASSGSLIAASSDSTWISDLLVLIDAILIALGRDPGPVTPPQSPEQAMTYVQQQYAISGIPSNLSSQDRAALNGNANGALALLNSAPSSVDPSVVASFRGTLRDICIKTSGPGGPSASQTQEPALAR